MVKPSFIYCEKCAIWIAARVLERHVVIDSLASMWAPEDVIIREGQGWTWHLCLCQQDNRVAFCISRLHDHTYLLEQRIDASHPISSRPYYEPTLNNLFGLLWHKLQTF